MLYVLYSFLHSKSAIAINKASSTEIYLTGKKAILDATTLKAKQYYFFRGPSLAIVLVGGGGVDQVQFADKMGEQSFICLQVLQFADDAPLHVKKTPR